ncbi:MAG: response regulator [Chloroflexota bacterium]|nr:response regulator [Chloroflexota bacterium]
MEQAGSTEDLRILVADDDSGIRELLREVLSSHGYAVELAVNGAEALALVRANPPAVVLMDLMMPTLSGAEATTALKADPATAEIPVVAMSAGRNLAVMAAGIPADDFISKPFDLSALVSTLVYLSRRTAPA